MKRSKAMVEDDLVKALKELKKVQKKDQDRTPVKPKYPVWGKMVEIVCAYEGCDNHKMVREADVKRGKGLYCSGHCSSKQRELNKKRATSSK